MSALSIQPTYPIFTETDGLPLENGYIWIGTANLDPQGNPINVYWDAALTILAPQPIRTINGYPSRSGTPGRMYVNSDYSIRVQNSKGSMVYSAPEATERYSSTVVTLTAAQIEFLQAGAGAVAQSTQDKIRRDVAVSIGDYGGGAGESAAVNDAAIADAFAVSNIVEFPSGTVQYATTIALGGNKQIIGKGNGVTILEYTGSSHGVSVSGSGNKVQFLQIKASPSAASGVYLNSALINFFEDVYVTGNPPKGWWLYGDDLNSSVYWNIFQDCGCNNAVLPVLLEGTGTGAVNANSWYDGIWRTSSVAPTGVVCYLNGGGFGTGGNNFIGGDWTGYGCNTFVLDGTAHCTQNSFFGVFVDTSANTGIVLGAGVSTTTIIGGVWQATTPVVQNNIAGGTNETDIIMISSLRYLPFIMQPAWSTPTLLNSWVNYGGTGATAQYYKDPNQIVHIKGVVKNGTTTPGTNLFVLPAGFRPLLNHTFAQVSYNGGVIGFAAVTVAQNGAVYVETTTGNTFLSIDCSFKAEQ